MRAMRYGSEPAENPDLEEKVVTATRTKTRAAGGAGVIGSLSKPTSCKTARSRGTPTDCWSSSGARMPR